MRPATLWTLCLFVCATSQSLGATELSRLFVDLNHDGKTEVVRLDSSPSKTSHRAKLRISVGKSAYTTDYFAADGDPADVQVVQLNRASGLAGLLLTSVEASGCVRHLLSYIDGALRLIMKHDAGPSCYRLVTYGDLRFSVSTWEGFWERAEMYQIATNGKTAVRLGPTEYLVLAAGYAGVGLELQGATCGNRLVTPGAYLIVKKFDPIRSRFLVETPDGGCGWVPSSEFNTESQKILGLPWAG